jgi:hypothetical protein
MPNVEGYKLLQSSFNGKYSNEFLVIKQFVEDVKELIDAELIAEHLMGTSLKRD